MIVQQQDPATMYCRPLSAIMEQMRRLIEELGIPVQVYDGTNMDEVAQRVSTVLVQNGGGPSAIVCFHDSSFGNHPRRTSRFTILVVSGDTRVLPGIPGAIDAAWRIEGALDRLISQDELDGCPVTDIFEVESEEAIPVKDAGASCAIGISVIVKDY